MHSFCWLVSFYGRERLRLFCREEGQDLLEYSLLLAFIGLSGAALFISVGGLTSSLWSISNGRLASANSGS